MWKRRYAFVTVALTGLVLAPLTVAVGQTAFQASGEEPVDIQSAVNDFRAASRLLLRRASDQFGRAPVLVPALVAIALGTALLALPPTIGSLIAGAVLLGTGNSMLYPTFVALVVDRAPPTERGLAIGTLSGAWDVGVFIGAPIVARLVEARGYSAGFLASALAVVLGLAAFLVTERSYRRSPARAAVTD